MKHSIIALERVDLFYQAVAYRERSLKAWLAKRFSPHAATSKVQDVHALKSISLTIKPGERVGLLGHNGAGKSTFLRMVAGLYPIASGKRTVHGDIRALFELGLGFEPDGTGRENIFYRSLLLGVPPKKIREMEAQIVAFADLGEFIDYPIKTYSAGMKVRLAFAVSTAIGGDILLMDEVLAAGDAAFMVKAKARISELIKQSEILILASHDLGSLQSLCERGLVFQKGAIVFDGKIEQAIVEYKKVQGLK